jgi:hypothetical protein
MIIRFYSGVLSLKGDKIISKRDKTQKKGNKKVRFSTAPEKGRLLLYHL